MTWVQRAGQDSAIAILDAQAAPVKIKRTDKIGPLLEEGLKQHEQGDLERALVAYQQVMGLDKEHVGAMMAAATLHTERGEYDAAEWLLKRALSIAPTCYAYNTLGQIQLGRRNWDGAVNAFRASLALDPTNLTTWPNLIFALDVHPGASPGLRFFERRLFNDLHCKPLTDAAAPHTNDPDPERKLRVGYVSGDFRQHSGAHGFGPVVFGHHRDRVEVHLYDVAQAPPADDDRVAAYFRDLPETTWHDLRGYDDATVAASIRADEIDILVDLVGYSAGCRALAFARKPAPLQVSGFGYATGLGIDAIDYVVADDVVIPPQHEGRYAERPLRLPCFMGYEKAPPWPELAPPPALTRGYPTFGYFGRAIKMSPQTLSLWADILRRMPQARMIFKSGDYQDAVLVTQVTSTLAALGVNPAHLEFRTGTSRFDHIAAYNDIDVSLDPFPHAGGVTTIESLLMGVPTITLLGDYICGRTGASYLTLLGFKSAIARTPFEYAEHAISTASEVWTLEDRQAMRFRLLTSVLLSDDGYATAVEDAYRTIWREWCQDRTRAEVAPL